MQNLMRMLLMDKVTEEYEGMDAKTALKELNSLPAEEYRKLHQVAVTNLLSQEMQEYLDRKQIKELLPLEPIPTDEALEIMDEFSLNRLTLYELPLTEWD